jgi:hypothetical protein
MSYLKRFVKKMRTNILHSIECVIFTLAPYSSSHIVLLLLLLLVVVVVVVVVVLVVAAAAAARSKA